MPDYGQPNEEMMRNPRSLARAIFAGQSIDGPRQTTASMGGTPQQQVTAQSISDILQGTMGVRGPEDTLLVINKALSSQLDNLYTSGSSSGSMFSTVRRDDIPPPQVPEEQAEGGGDAGGTDGGSSYTPGVIPPDNIPAGGQKLPWGATIFGNNTIIPGERVAQFAYWAGFRGETLVEVVAIAKRESQYMPYIRALNVKTQDDSYGLMMINMIKSAHPNATDSEYLAMLGVPGTDKNLLREPQVNMNAAFAMYTRAGNTLRPWGGYKGKTNTYNTDVNAARQIVAKAESLGYFRERPTGWSDSGGGGGGGGSVNPGSSGSSTAGNTAEEIMYAQAILANHPNNWAARDNTNGFKDMLLNGLKHNNKYIVYKNPKNGYALLVPNLINYLYMILEGGFILAAYGNSIRTSNVGSGRPSFHNYGAAIDIFGFGLASEGKFYGIESNRKQAERIGDAMWNHLASLPKSSWADENAWHLKRNYGTQGFKTYVDPNPNHWHFGFRPDHHGTLISALKRRAPTTLLTRGPR